ncbi:hypothetical protein ACD661_09225 [Legionella lytica]|uniref:Uncharacterized protein n=1 Tax=Legionella lytica TaxID=96232 RepID=A0ABW8D7P7_9GAMM
MSNLSPENIITISAFISSYKYLNETEKKLFPPKIKELFDAKIQFKSTKTLAMIASEVIQEFLQTPPSLKFPCISKFIESDLFQCCKLLKTNELFSDANTVAVLSYPKPQKPFPNADYQPLLNLPKLKELFSALYTLQQHQLLADAECLTAVMRHEMFPLQVAKALTILNKADLLNAKTMAITTHPTNPAAAAKILTLLSPLGLLSGEHAENNFEKVMKHPRPASLLLDIELLAAEDANPQQKFEKIMCPRAYTAPLLLTGVLQGDLMSIEIESPFHTKKSGGVVASMIPGAL